MDEYDDSAMVAVASAYEALLKYRQGPDEDGEYSLEPEDGWRLVRDLTEIFDGYYGEEK